MARAACDVPVTADIEGGYTYDLDQLADTIRAVIGAGAVGINLEDGRREPEPARPQDRGGPQGRGRAGVRLFINARTDVYLKGLADGHAAYVETTRAGRALPRRRRRRDLRAGRRRTPI